MMGFLATQGRLVPGGNQVLTVVMERRESLGWVASLDTPDSLDILVDQVGRERRETRWTLLSIWSVSGEIQGSQGIQDLLDLKVIQAGRATKASLDHRDPQVFPGPKA